MANGKVSVHKDFETGKRCLGSKQMPKVPEVSNKGRNSGRA